MKDACRVMHDANDRYVKTTVKMIQMYLHAKFILSLDTMPRFE